MPFSFGLAAIALVLFGVGSVSLMWFADWANHVVFGKDRAPTRWKVLYGVVIVLSLAVGTFLVQPQYDAFHNCRESGQSFGWCMQYANKM